LEYHNSPSSFDYMHTSGGDRLRNRPFLHLSDLRDVDLGSGHTAYHPVSLINASIYIPNFV